MTNVDTLSPGFSDPVAQIQVAFRRILDATAQPGTVVAIGEELSPPKGLHAAAAAVLLTLADYETPIWLSDGLFQGQRQRDAAREFLKFHCGASIIDAPNDAAFAILDGGDVTPALDAFNPGPAEYPDRSTTVIFQMDRLMAGCGHTLRGPGIQDHVKLDLSYLPSERLYQRRQFRPEFPLGIDLILASPNDLAAIPRTIEIGG